MQHLISILSSISTCVGSTLRFWWFSAWVRCSDETEVDSEGLVCSTARDSVCSFRWLPHNITSQQDIAPGWSVVIDSLPLASPIFLLRIAGPIWWPWLMLLDYLVHWQCHHSVWVQLNATWRLFSCFCCWPIPTVVRFGGRVCFDEPRLSYCRFRMLGFTIACGRCWRDKGWRWICI